MRVAVAAVVSAALGACGPSISREVGASCTGNDDCDERCLTGGEWPAGFCTVSCDRDGDCPSDTRCMDDGGGSCGFACDSDPDCDFLGSGYACVEVDARGSARKVQVCRSS